MYPIKTSKALDELKTRQHGLKTFQRTMLLLCTGQRSLNELSVLMNGPVDAMVNELIASGFLVPARPQATAQPTPQPAPQPSPPAAQPVVADQFLHGKSIAAARMYLFDMAERFFVRSQPALIAQLRQLLRESRDTQALVEVAWLLLSHIEVVAGAERTDAVRQRLSTMLPIDTLDLATEQS